MVGERRAVSEALEDTSRERMTGDGLRVTSLKFKV